MTVDIEQFVFDMQKQACQVVNDLNIIQAWEKAGAKVNLVGSLKTGLLVKHRDIDFHIYTDELNPNLAFSVIQEFAASPNVRKIEYANLADKEDCCLEFHVWVLDDKGDLWQIDMINIKKGSKYDGYFEKIADTILEKMTPDKRKIIWNLKYQTLENEKIAGIEYCKAVLQDGVQTFDEFLNWRKQHHFTGIIAW